MNVRGRRPREKGKERKGKEAGRPRAEKEGPAGVSDVLSLGSER